MIDGKRLNDEEVSESVVGTVEQTQAPLGEAVQLNNAESEAQFKQKMITVCKILGDGLVIPINRTTGFAGLQLSGGVSIIEARQIIADLHDALEKQFVVKTP